jgi:hypothetical protein
VSTRRILTGAAVALAVMSSATPSLAEGPLPDLLGLGPGRVTVSEEAHFGVATAPFEARSLPEAKGQALAFVTEGWLRVDGLGWVGLRVPAVAGSMAQPAGSYIDEAAWGNPEVRAAARAVLVDRERLSLRLTVGGGVGVPVAEHAASLLPNRVLAIANGARGFADPELFRPGRLPLTPFAQLDATTGRWRVIGLLKVPLLLRLTDADLPSGESRSRAVGLAAVARVEGRVAITRAFGLSLSTQLFVDALPAVAHVRETSPLQLLLRGGPFFAIADRVSIAVDVQAPVGGALGGSTVAAGIRLGAALD